MAILLGLGAALTYGAADFIGGLATRRTAVLSVVLLSQVMGTAPLLVVVAAMGGAPSTSSIAWGAAAGVGGAAGVICLYHGLAVGRMSVVAPTTAVIAATVPVVFGLGAGERPSPMALAGVVLALAAVALVSATRDDPAAKRARPQGLGAALGAGIAFAAFFIALDQAGSGEGLWPLVGSRVSSLVVVGALVLVTRTPLRPARGTGAAIAATGVLDVGANALYLLATRHGLLALVAVLTSLYPASTVALARVVLGERLTPVRVGGLGAAAVGVALMAAG